MAPAGKPGEARIAELDKLLDRALRDLASVREETVKFRERGNGDRARHEALVELTRERQGIVDTIESERRRIVALHQGSR